MVQMHHSCRYHAVSASKVPPAPLCREATHCRAALIPFFQQGTQLTTRLLQVLAPAENEPLSSPTSNDQGPDGKLDTGPLANALKQVPHTSFLLSLSVPSLLLRCQMRRCCNQLWGSCLVSMSICM